MKQFPYLSNVIFLLILGLYQVLYLKNLSPRVTERDLVSLFARFQEKKGPPIQFRMMTGRMRGQAFITFPSKQLHLDNYSVMAESLISSLATTYALSNLNIAHKRSISEEGKRTQDNMFFFFFLFSLLCFLSFFDSAPPPYTIVLSFPQLGTSYSLYQNLLSLC